MYIHNLLTGNKVFPSFWIKISLNQSSPSKNPLDPDMKTHYYYYHHLHLFQIVEKTPKGDDRSCVWNAVAMGQNTDPNKGSKVAPFTNVYQRWRGWALVQGSALPVTICVTCKTLLCYLTDSYSLCLDQKLRSLGDSEYDLVVGTLLTEGDWYVVSDCNIQRKVVRGQQPSPACVAWHIFRSHRALNIESHNKWLLHHT